MKGPETQSHAFTSTHDGIARVLVTACKVCDIFDPAVQVPPVQHDFHAIWDTGATGSVITRAVAERCGLVPSGMVQTHGVHGTSIVPTYFVNIVLPNRVMCEGVRVTEGILPGGTGGDVLIGMDIITAGDFSVSNVGGKTVFSFRVPSSKTVDFVKDHQNSLNPALSHGQGRQTAQKKKKPGKQFGKNKR